MNLKKKKDSLESLVIVVKTFVTVASEVKIIVIFQFIVSITPLKDFILFVRTGLNSLAHC